MRPENLRMKEFLKSQGIECQPKYMWAGSLRGTWRLYNPNVRWSAELAAKLNALGFTTSWNEPLNAHSGNGGMFSVFVRALGEAQMAEIQNPVIADDVEGEE